MRRNNTKRQNSLALIFWLHATLIPAQAFAEQVKLNNGQVLEGEIIRQNAKYLVIKTSDGRTIKLPQEKLAKPPQSRSEYNAFGSGLPMNANNGPQGMDYGAILQRAREFSAQANQRQQDMQRMIYEAEYGTADDRGENLYPSGDTISPSRYQPNSVNRQRSEQLNEDIIELTDTSSKKSKKKKYKSLKEIHQETINSVSGVEEDSTDDVIDPAMYYGNY